MPWIWSLIGGCIAIAALGGVFALVAHAPGVAVAVFVGAVFLLPIGWMVVSAVSPPRLDRHCPACGAWALEPLDPAARYGARCTACGFEDVTIPGARLGHEPPA